MKVAGVARRTIWVEQGEVRVIDQTRLPHEFAVIPLRTWEEAAHAIRAMQVRGAPLIGVTAAYGVALAMRDDSSDAALARACAVLHETRPTAVNLAWALREMRAVLAPLPPSERERVAFEKAAEICEEDVATSRRIGEFGYPLLEAVARKKGRVDVLTHCNAGWLATVDWGTALAPIFLAHDRGLDVHVWVDETRPRSQGYLTAWELQQHGVPHTLVVDNVGGHLMQHGLVDLCIVGTDRTTRRGDVCNKIGTYLKALAADDNGVPFYAAVPHSSIDFALDDGVKEIPIEERDGREVHEIPGRAKDGAVVTVAVTPSGTRTRNYGFDVTPARLMTGLITDRGVCEATYAGLARLFPERA
jgi:methylthioribose-1-phosphate isomerase